METFWGRLVETHKTDNRKFWAKIKSLRGNKRKEIKTTRDKNNEIQKGVKEILEVLVDH